MAGQALGFGAFQFLVEMDPTQEPSGQPHVLLGRQLVPALVVDQLSPGLQPLLPVLGFPCFQHQLERIIQNSRFDMLVDFALLLQQRFRAFFVDADIEGGRVVDFQDPRFEVLVEEDVDPYDLVAVAFGLGFVVNRLFSQQGERLHASKQLAKGVLHSIENLLCINILL